MSEPIQRKGEVEEVISGESEILHDLGKGIVAGCAATAVVAVLFLLKNLAGLLPEFNFIDMLTMLSGYSWQGAGWIMFFVGGGAALGALFAFLDARAESTIGSFEPVRGAIFGAIVWLVLMLLFMPIYGGGAFGLNFGIGAPIVMLAANLIYGLILGAVYAALKPEAVMT